MNHTRASYKSTCENIQLGLITQAFKIERWFILKRLTGSVLLNKTLYSFSDDRKGIYRPTETNVEPSSDKYMVLNFNILYPQKITACLTLSGWALPD